MSMTERDLYALQKYADSLEKFKRDIETYCNNLETGIQSCSKYMLDENSQKILKKGRQVSEQIKTCLNPTQRILENVQNQITIINDSELQI